MGNSKSLALFLRVVMALMVVALLSKSGNQVGKLWVRARPGQTERGDYGGDMALLRRSYTGPGNSGESNCYFDLWSPGALPIFTRVNGLTNNRALLVDSHGKAGCSGRGDGYGFYPNAALVPSGQPTPVYSARDLAKVMGPDQAGRIHNIVLAGCNEEGRFRSEELRQYFPNATNIVYMTPGELAYKPMFYQAILYPSEEIRTLFGKPRRAKGGGTECEIVVKAAEGTQALGHYVADLYQPGGTAPYCTVRAGRELLQPAAAKGLGRTRQ